MDISSVFQQTELSVHVPLLPGPFQVPTDEQDKAAWFERLVATSAERESCFYDEKLLYLCKLEFRANAMTRPGWQEAVEHIAKSIKINTTCAFIASLPAHRQGPPPNDRRRSVLPLQPNHNHYQQTNDSSQHLGPNSAQNLQQPPVTPNPQPGIKNRYAQYANIEGITVCEGPMAPYSMASPAQSSDAPPLEPHIVKRSAGPSETIMTAYYLAQVPLTFANVDMPDPLLALTCQATLREKAGSAPKRLRGLGFADEQENMTVESAVPEIKLPPSEEESGGDRARDVVTLQVARERDVLQGLAGPSTLPLSRLFPSSSSVSSPSDHRHSAQLAEHSTSTTVLRKSFRAILPILSVLTVRMRTLPVACLPPPHPFTDSSTSINQQASSSSAAAANGHIIMDSETDRDLVATICIEVEAGQLKPKEQEFEVEKIQVVAGRQGVDMTALAGNLPGKPRVTLALPHSGDPSNAPPVMQFPFAIRTHDQRNLIYNITARTSAGNVPSGSRPATVNSLSTNGARHEEFGGSWGQQVEPVPLRIDVVGRVKNISNQEDKATGSAYVNSSFSSTWNTVIDLRTPDKQNQLSIFRSTQPPPPPPHLRNRPISSTSAVSTPTNMTTARSQPGPSARVSSARLNPNHVNPSAFHRDLVVTAKVMPELKQTNGEMRIEHSQAVGDDDTANLSNHMALNCFEVFYLELSVLNASGRTVKLMVGSREFREHQQGATGHDREKASRRLLECSQMPSSSHLTSRPRPGFPYGPPPSSSGSTEAVILLEDDILLPPLLPRSCQAVRIRCMPLQKGVHSLPVLQVIDNDRDLVADLRFDMHVKVV